MRMSKAAKNLLLELEGEKLTAYKCQAGHLTIGCGILIPVNGTDNHKLYWKLVTGIDVADVVEGKTQITQTIADKLFDHHIQVFESSVEKMVEVTLRQNEFDALVLLCFNIGPGALNKSSIKTALNSGDFDYIADKIMLYSKVRMNGALKVSRGLLVRRAIEALVFLHPEMDPKLLTGFNSSESKRVVTLLTNYKKDLERLS
jgi:lysozyme